MVYGGLARGIRICGGIEELNAEPVALYVPSDRSKLGSLSRRVVPLCWLLPFRLAIDPRALAGFDSLCFVNEIN